MFYEEVPFVVHEGEDPCSPHALIAGCMSITLRAGCMSSLSELERPPPPPPSSYGSGSHIFYMHVHMFHYPFALEFALEGADFPP